MTTTVDFNYMMREIRAGRAKKPWRGMKRRLFKKNYRHMFDTGEIFLVATNANVGDVYYEHERNHRIVEITKPRRPSNWHSVSRHGRVAVIGNILNEEGCYICGCGDGLGTPIARDVAAELVLLELLAQIDRERFFTLAKKLNIDSERAHEYWDNNAEVRDDQNYFLFMTWCANKIKEYDECGWSTFVDNDGVMLQSHRAVEKDIWNMCFRHANDS